MQYHTVHYVEHPGEVIVPSVERGGGEDLVIHSTVVTGDASDVLRGVPDELFRTVVTSPPYWSLRDYSSPGQLGLEDDPDEYVRSLVSVFDEVRRVLTKDGVMWLNIGDSYTSGGRT